MQRAISRNADNKSWPRRLVLPFTTLALAASVLPPVAWAQRGDMNCDGIVSTADVPLLIDALLASPNFNGCDLNRADTNGDSRIDGGDLQAFVGMLLAPVCPPPLTYCGGCVDTTYNNGHCGGCGIVCGSQETCVGGVCEPSQPCPECAAR